MPDLRAALPAAKAVFAWFGFGLALLGIALDDRRIVWGAIGSLAVAFVLRLALRRMAPPSSPDGP